MVAVTNINELRSFLAHELEKVSTGEGTPASANAAANLCGKMLSSIKMELEYTKQIGVTPSIDFIRPPKVESKKIEVKS
jgi:hypothetical protein